MMKKHLKKREIRKLCEITDLAKLMKDNGKYFHFEGGGDNLYCRCPFHRENTASLCIVQKKKFFYCFGCGESGDALRWLELKYRYIYHGDRRQECLGKLLSFNNISVKGLRKLCQKENIKDAIS